MNTLKVKKLSNGPHLTKSFSLDLINLKIPNRFLGQILMDDKLYTVPLAIHGSISVITSWPLQSTKFLLNETESTLAFLTSTSQ
jgi:hypothetical protein